MAKTEKSLIQKALPYIAITFAIGILIVGCRKIQNRASKPHDSPVEVGGGSIYGHVGTFNLNTWTTITPNQLYSAPSTDSDYIKFKGFTDKDGKDALQNPVQGTGGWKITITTMDGSSPITICSSINTSTPRSCSGDSVSDGTVYVQTSGGGQWNRKFYWTKDRLIFQGCAAGGDESPCNEIASIAITTVNPLGGLAGPFKCPNNKKCRIKVGK